ncbi:MAG: hypothetical protein IJX97_01650 [Clostridia bacterium]|nr:hypothetical protein [Clostridia bacterium]
MNDKQLDFGQDKDVHTVIYSKARDQRYVIVFDKTKEFFTYTLESIHLYDEEEWWYVCHRYDALPAYWSAIREAGTSFFGTFDEVMKEIKSEPTYKELFV